jgi:hypothetical protein
MSKFKEWYVTHQDAITWFLIGWIASSGLTELVKGNYIWSAVLFVIAYANYLLRQQRLS